MVGQLTRVELNLHQMGLTSQVSAPENLASSGGRHASFYSFLLNLRRSLCCNWWFFLCDKCTQNKLVNLQHGQWHAFD